MRCRIIIEGALFERADVYEDCAIVSIVQSGMHQGRHAGAGGAGGAGAQLQTLHAAAVPAEVSWPSADSNVADQQQMLAFNTCNGR